MAILSKGCKPDNFEPHKSVKRRFRKLQGLHSNVFDVNLFLNQTFLTFLLYVRQTWMTRLVLEISVKAYLPLIRKDSITLMYGLAVHINEGLAFAQDLFLENSADCYLCFRLALFYLASCFSFIFRSPLSLWTVFYSICPEFYIQFTVLQTLFSA